MSPEHPVSQTKLAAGQVLGGKYRVARVIQRGGMGTVVLAHHEELDQRVAVKLLGQEYTDDPQVVARFVREARAAAKLESDHVVRVMDVGTFQGLGPYLVMEYLSGHDLGSLVKQRGPLAVAEAVDYVLQAIDALAEAHSLGIVHRDVKPSNLFLAERADGSFIIKVLDFGISKMQATDGPSDQNLTSARTVLGSPLYMSPEQLRSSKNVDARTDIWALGVVLYELLTAARPFEGQSLVELVRRISEEEPTPIGRLRPDVPPALEIAVMRCLQRDPDDRFANVAELGLAIAPFGTGRATKEVDRAISLFRRRLPSLTTEAIAGEGERTEVMIGPSASLPAHSHGSSAGMARASSAGMAHVSSGGMPLASSAAIAPVRPRSSAPAPPAVAPAPPSRPGSYFRTVVLVATIAFVTPLLIGALVLFLLDNR
jgi:eukaryotic-like serine/threonine-protein kinase